MRLHDPAMRPGARLGLRTVPNFLGAARARFWVKPLGSPMNSLASPRGVTESDVGTVAKSSAGDQFADPQSAIGPYKPVRRALKRALDIVVSLLVLILCLPMFGMIALLLRITSPGPVLYSHPRVGRHGRIFPCYKFRTMLVDGDRILAEHLSQNPVAMRNWQECQKLENDPRVTWIGRILRKSSLDELPQFYNILLGQMSCVGPRPVSPPELERYGTCAAEYLSVRPGLTGIWQISGRSRLSYGMRVTLDADYVRQWSLRRDLLILVKTVPAVLKLNEAA